MTVLVTGAAGFVGLALVKRLRADGEQVRALALRGDRRLPELRALDVEVVEADVTDAAAIAPHFAGVERVFHAAALVHGWHPWERYRAVNIGGTQQVARAAQAAGVRRFVHISTSDVFGIPRDGAVIDESRPFDYWREPYPDTKIEAERWLWQFHRDSGLPLSVIYPGWVYGPGDEALFPGFAQAIRDGLLVFWQRDTKLAWAHVGNLADAIVLVSREPAAVGQGYLVHDDADGPTLEAVSARLAAILGRPLTPRYVPYAVAFAAAAAAQGVWRLLPLRGGPPVLTADVKAFGFRFRFSTAKLRALGWTPRVGIGEGMEQAFAYFTARQKASS
ncbi:MAG TPA: NAD-dependent epimerase/dehydratase family protein [Candidatus Dormibacteraeota bacterium]|nr:NAD-dependent epimerase/dehydratase family protein [Candidatus Dormibacteraeota bacterium]